MKRLARKSQASYINTAFIGGFLIFAVIVVVMFGSEYGPTGFATETPQATIEINQTNITENQTINISENFTENITENLTENQSNIPNTTENVTENITELNLASNETQINQTNETNQNTTNKTEIHGQNLNINANCVVPTENMVITQDTTFCSGVYYLNDADHNGVIRIGSDDIMLDCNASSLIGNGDINSYGIFSTYSNVTIKNCIISKYNYAGFANGDANNNVYINNQITDSVHVGLYSYGNDNLTVKDNKFINSSIYFAGNINAVIQNNSFVCPIAGCGGRSESIMLENTQRIKTMNNSIVGGQYGIQLYKSNYFLNITKNVIENTDQGMLMIDGNNDNNAINIYNNLFKNNSNAYDDFLLDIHMINETSINVYDNSFTESPDFAILLTGSSNINIHDNSFNIICINNRFNYQGNAQNEPCTAIMIKQLFKTWCYSDDCDVPYAMSNILEASSSNINIKNNIFNNDTNVYLFLQGATNVSQDLTNYWYRSFEFPNIAGKEELYINNNWSEVRNAVNYYFESIAHSLYEGYALDLSMIWGIRKNESYYKNVASTDKSANIYSATAGYPYNDVKNKSNNVILATNVDNFSITLAPNQEIIVGNFTNKSAPNYAPAISGIALSGSNPNFNINCSATISDADSDTLNVSVGWYKNSVLSYYHEYNTDYASGTNFKTTLDKANLSVGDLWHCQLNVTDGIAITRAYSSNITMINHAPSITTTKITRLNDTLNCTIAASDVDSDQLNISVAWYDNNVLNFIDNYSSTNNVEDLSTPVLADGDRWYCKAIVTDGKNTTIKYSSNLTIVDISINHPPSIDNLDAELSENTLTCTLNASDPDDNQLNSTISWYKNNVLNQSRIFNTNDVSYNINVSTVLNDQWYCKASVTDGANTTIGYSENITISDNTPPNLVLLGPSNGYSSTDHDVILSYSVSDDYHQNLNCSLYMNGAFFDSYNITNGSTEDIDLALTVGNYNWNITCLDPLNNSASEQRSFSITNPSSPSSGGGGGGGGSSIYIPPDLSFANESSNTPAVEQPQTFNQTDNNTQAKTIDTNVQNTEPVKENIEQPKPVEPSIVRVVSRNLDVYVVGALVFIILTMFIIRNGKPIETDEKILRYTRQALMAGYSYDAIRRALRTRHNNSTIDHHFHILMMHDYKPLIRFEKPATRNVPNREPLIKAIKDYIKAQKAQGFNDTDIKNALLHYGHDKSIVEDSFKV